MSARLPCLSPTVTQSPPKSQNIHRMDTHTDPQATQQVPSLAPEALAHAPEAGGDSALASTSPQLLQQQAPPQAPPPTTRVLRSRTQSTGLSASAQSASNPVAHAIVSPSTLLGTVTSSMGPASKKSARPKQAKTKAMKSDTTLNESTASVSPISSTSSHETKKEADGLVLPQRGETYQVKQEFTVKQEPNTKQEGAPVVTVKQEPSVKTEIKQKAKPKKEAAEPDTDASGSSDDDDSSDVDSGDDSASAHHVCVRCVSLASLGSNSKSEKTVGFSRFVYVYDITPLQMFLDKVEACASIELVGPRIKWIFSLESKGRNDPFKNGVALDPNDHMSAATYEKWLEGIIAGAGSPTINVYGIAKASVVTKHNEESCVPLKHVDPDIAAAADRIVKANTCGDLHCAKRSMAYPACWPTPGKEEHLSLKEGVLIPWATALASGQNKVTEKNPPNMYPYVDNKKSKSKDKTGKKRKAKEAKAERKKDKKRAKHTHNIEDKGTQSGPSKAPGTEPAETKKTAPIIIEISDSSSGEDDDEAKLDLEGKAGQVEAHPVTLAHTPHAPKLGHYMPIDEFAAAYGLPTSILGKLQGHLVPDTWVLAELDASDLAEAGLVKAEPKVLAIVLERWRREEPVVNNKGKARAIHPPSRSSSGVLQPIQAPNPAQVLAEPLTATASVASSAD
ncbi:hypothetical protein V8E36_007761 [Tilletia maclaganii]